MYIRAVRESYSGWSVRRYDKVEVLDVKQPASVSAAIVAAYARRTAARATTPIPRAAARPTPAAAANINPDAVATYLANIPKDVLLTAMDRLGIHPPMAYLLTIRETEDLAQEIRNMNV